MSERTSATKPTRPRSATGPVRLDRLADACLGPAVMRQGFASAGMVAAWPEIVGPELAARTRPERIRWPRRREGATATLIVRAEAGDAIEIQHLSGHILERINVFLGWPAVGRVSVRQASVSPPPVRARAMSAGRTGPADAPVIGGITDDALRAALAQLGHHIASEADKST